MLKDFKVYQLSKEFYQLCKVLKLPRFLKDQLMRSSSSVALNIAEGSGKRTEKDQARFYSIVLGSLRESQAILDIENIENKKIYALADQLGAILYKLSKIKKI